MMNDIDYAYVMTIKTYYIGNKKQPFYVWCLR